MIPPDPNCFTEFTDDVMRPVFEDARGQYLLDEGEEVYGVWFIPREQADLPDIMEAQPGRSADGPFCGRWPCSSLSAARSRCLRSTGG